MGILLSFKDSVVPLTVGSSLDSFWVWTSLNLFFGRFFKEAILFGRRDLFALSRRLQFVHESDLLGRFQMNKYSEKYC